MRSRLAAVVLLVLNSFGVFGQYGEITTRSYDLQVPGSDPIRIIEAEPLWDRNPQDMVVPITTERSWTGLEHRALKSRMKVTPFHTRINNKNDENETEDTTQDSAEELRKFLKEYAQQYRRTARPPVDNENDEFDSSEHLHKVELITKPSDEPTNRLANLFLDDKTKDNPGGDDKSKTWNLLHLNRQKHPPEDKDGWVSLEVVPWSVSKVSRWHSNNVKSSSAQTTQQKPWDNKYSNNYNTNFGNSKPMWSHSSKPLVNYRPGSVNYQTKPFDYGSSNIDNKPNPRPSFSLPSATYGQKVYLQQDYTDEIPKPSWNKDTTNFYNIHSHYDGEENDANCEDNEHSGIITDGLPPNFPKPQHEYNRRKGNVRDDHPASHPSNGDGEWVLLSTTKGYKAPSSNGRQRSLDIESNSDLDKESISTHKSVRLTVLPPLKDSKINMTTSHGGLLQVESTFQTVEEAHRMALKKQNMKKRPLKRRKPLKQTVGSVVPTLTTNQRPSTPVTTRKKAPDASSVLAAVGAGMIPATMAMLVPMMGRRRRRDLIYSTRSPNIVGLELQLPQFA